jgi:4-amino-4-deoxy-L-arabinose transferase-like glycosyltransferase
MHLGAWPALITRRTQFVRSMSDRGAALLLAGVAVALALAARLAWPFDGLYGQDAFAYFRYARALWPWLLRGEPLPIYYWPAGYPLLVALALPLFGGSSAAGQAVSIASVAVAAACTFRLSRELLPDAPGGRLVAWVAGLAVACCGDALRASLVTMSDALALAGCTVALWALARYRHTRRGRWLAAAAVALGWATITRWVCGLLALPMLGFLIADCRLQIANCKLQIAKSKIDLVIALGIGALIVVPQVLLSQQTPAALSEHQWLRTWNIANVWRRDFVTVDGAQHYQLPVGGYYLARMAWPSLLFPLLALLCLPGALWLLRRRRWPALALLAGWPLLLWLFLSGIPYQNARFILPALPALAALAGLGFGWAYERTMDDGRWTMELSSIVHRPSSIVETIYLPPPIRRSARSILLIILAVSLVGSLGWGLRGYRNLVAYKNEQLALVDWARAQLPAGGTLITFGATLTFQHYTDYDVRELFYLAPPDLDQIAQQPQSAYLLLDVGNIESQWAGLRPQQDYRYLLEHPGLVIIGQRGPYTLFRLRAVNGTFFLLQVIFWP